LIKKVTWFKIQVFVLRMFDERNVFGIFENKFEGIKMFLVFFGE
jgi:hypothetical protein